MANLIPSEFFTKSSKRVLSETESSSSSPRRYCPTQKQSQQTAASNQNEEALSFCPVKTIIKGSKFSKESQCEYRIKIHPSKITFLHEQAVYNVLTNIHISNMDSFCMFLQTNSEDTFHTEYKLFTQGFIPPTYCGPLVVKIKNIGSYTKVLYPCDIMGYLTIQPFLKPEEFVMCEQTE